MEQNASAPRDDVLLSVREWRDGAARHESKTRTSNVPTDGASGNPSYFGARIRSTDLKRHNFAKPAVLLSVKTSLPFQPKMAAPVLSTLAVSSLPAISSSVTATAAARKREIYTINDLLRLRALGETAHDPIVAYPSSGTDYVYYTPHQVKFFAPIVLACYSH